MSNKAARRHSSWRIRSVGKQAVRRQILSPRHFRQLRRFLADIRSQLEEIALSRVDVGKIVASHQTRHNFGERAGHIPSSGRLMSKAAHCQVPKDGVKTSNCAQSGVCAFASSAANGIAQKTAKMPPKTRATVWRVSAPPPPLKIQEGRGNRAQNAHKRRINSASCQSQIFHCYTSVL